MGETHLPQKLEESGVAALLTVAMISLATLGTAWCAFQSALWGSRQAFAIVDTTEASIRATEASLSANQLAMLDVSMFLEWFDAARRGDTEVAGFYESHFRPELQGAFDAWKAMRERDRDSAPATPFAMPEYGNPERRRADALSATSRDASGRAMRYNMTSDQYAMMTVILTSVTVIAGLAEKLRHRRARVLAFLLATLLLSGSLIRVALMPITGPG